jgi:vancomycin resistance protein YoaR
MIGFSMLVLLGGPIGGWLVFVLKGATPTGLRVDGERLAPTSAPRAVLEQRARAWLDQDVRVTVGEDATWVSRRRLGARVDVEALERRVLDLGRSGLPWRDLPDLWAVWNGHTDLAWPVSFDQASLRAFVRAQAAEYDVAADGGALDFEGSTVQEPVEGRRVLRSRTVRELAAVIRTGGRAFDLPLERTAPPAPRRLPLPAPRLLSRYATRLRTLGGDRPRAHNVTTAAGYLNGAVIEPRGQLSFNGRVGARDRDHGYRKAHVILDGEIVDGMGGGVCQVASTLHAAAFYGGLEPVRHVPHSRPSEYIPMGLDATVVWPNVDLVIANPYRVPVHVRAYVRPLERDAEMVVELWAAARSPEVQMRTEVLWTEGWGTRYVEDPLVQPGAEYVSQTGIRGVVLMRERTLEDDRGVRVEQQRVTYPPTDRVVRIAPGGAHELPGASDDPSAEGGSSDGAGAAQLTSAAPESVF